MLSEGVIVAILGLIGTSVGALLGYCGVKRTAKDKKDVDLAKLANDAKSTDYNTLEVKLDSLSKCINSQNETIASIKEDINKTLSNHRDEYLKGISEVKSSITDMKLAYTETVAIVNTKIDALEEKQDKHNDVIARTYKLESRADVQDECIKVANHRIHDIEEKLK